MVSIGFPGKSLKFDVIHGSNRMDRLLKAHIANALIRNRDWNRERRRIPVAC